MEVCYEEKTVGKRICGGALRGRTLRVFGHGAGEGGVSLPLDEAGAETIALSDAGVNEADVTRLRTVREREDGEDVVEVEFSYGDNSYEYMLRESDGMILEWSIEGRAVEEAVAELTLTGDGAALAGGASAGAQGSDTAAEAQTGQEVSEEAQTDVDSPDGNTSGDKAPGDSAAAGDASVIRITADGTELIGYEEAVRIALDDSGIAEADAGIIRSGEKRPWK